MDILVLHTFNPHYHRFLCLVKAVRKKQTNKTIFFYKKTAKKIHFVAFLFSTLLIFKQDLRFIL